MHKSSLLLLTAALLPLIGCSSLDVEELLVGEDDPLQAPYDAAATHAVEVMREQGSCSEIEHAAVAADMARAEYQAATAEAGRRTYEAAPRLWSSDRMIEAQNRLPMPAHWCRNEGDSVGVLVDGRSLGALPVVLDAALTCRVYLATVTIALAEAGRLCRRDIEPEARVASLRAATAAEAAADAWETAGRLAREVLTAGGPPTPEALAPGLAGALLAASEATAAADDASLEAIEKLSQTGDGLPGWDDARLALEEVTRQTPDSEPLDRASILAERGRQAEAETLVYEFLHDLDRRETATVVAYVRLARAWLATATNLDETEQ